MYEDIFLDVTAALETLGQSERKKLFGGIWDDKFWMNTPGPLYYIGGMYDTEGILTAPNNIAVYDAFQVIYRQPVNRYELRQVAQAHQTFSPCTADGDLYWDAASVKTWWTTSRPAIENAVRHAYEEERAAEQRHYEDAIYLSGLRRWLEYLTDGMYQYLQVYAFFLENERVPTESDRLPEL
jgi:hypothetical protein